jgi:hypothetical protein
MCAKLRDNRRQRRRASALGPDESSGIGLIVASVQACGDYLIDGDTDRLNAIDQELRVGVHLIQIGLNFLKPPDGHSRTQHECTDEKANSGKELSTQHLCSSISGRRSLKQGAKCGPI